MRTETMTVQIGEWLGPVDPNYEAAQHAWGPDKGGSNPECVTLGFALIRQVEAEGWTYSPSGFSSYPIVAVGMYDGWPYWRPTPAIGYVGPIGVVEVAFFTSPDGGNTRRVSR